MIALLPSLALGAAFGHTRTTVASFAAGTAFQILVRSLEALAAALLYFDLKARASVAAAGPTVTTAPAATDESRPPGWYIDPADSRRMRYWAADGGAGWSERTAKTPKPMLREWQERHATEPRVAAMATEEHTAHSLDPDVYSDEGRPAGWYVDPNRPWRMRYWHAGEHQAWSKETTKTPEKAQSEWRDLRWRR
jgi:hypothetical protein